MLILYSTCQVVEQVRKTKLFFIGMLNYVNLYYVFSDQTLRGEDFSLVKGILADYLTKTLDAVILPGPMQLFLLRGTLDTYLISQSVN